MTGEFKLQLGVVEDKLDALPFAISVSDLSLPDQPLVFFNTAFESMTGYGREAIGQNCRFLQADLENGAARAEVNAAISTLTRTQVILHNQRHDGRQFYNLLLLDFVKGKGDAPDLAVGSQFDLGTEHPERNNAELENTLDDPLFTLRDPIAQRRLEQRRIAADATTRLLQSWYLIARMSALA